MAIYIMKCNECNYVFETFHSMDFDGPVVCPECDSIQTSKVPTAPGVILNWHQTDGVKIGTDRYRPPAVPNSISLGG